MVADRGRYLQAPGEFVLGSFWFVCRLANKETVLDTDLHPAPTTA